MSGDVAVAVITAGSASTAGVITGGMAWLVTPAQAQEAAKVEKTMADFVSRAGHDLRPL
ncbi:hypothetical protein [Streptomyces sp. NPDC001480]|uniref:hypothetical protein n=1 Tax=Streptomyces sp. NPDC001480 TaxID=3364577 RepID=UPI00368017EA